MFKPCDSLKIYLVLKQFVLGFCLDFTYKWLVLIQMCFSGSCHILLGFVSTCRILVVLHSTLVKRTLHQCGLLFVHNYYIKLRYINCIKHMPSLLFSSVNIVHTNTCYILYIYVRDDTSQKDFFVVYCLKLFKTL